jgi:hypothetical protein
MKPSTKKVSDTTVDELKSVIHEVMNKDMEAWGRHSKLWLTRN